MDENHLIRFFKFRLTKVGKRRWGCLDETQIAAYAGHQITGREKERTEAHLADCDFCLDQVALLVRMQNAKLPDSVPDSLLVRARKLARVNAKSEGSAVWRWGKIAAATAAACLVLVTVISLRHPRTVPIVAPHQNPIARPALVPSQIAPTIPNEQPPTVRGSKQSPLALTVVSPAAGSTVQANEIEFRWQSISGALDYEVNVLTPEGDQVWKQRTMGSSIQLAGDVKLEAGHKYFFTVRAYLAQGKSVQSAPVAFTVVHP